MSYVYAVVFKDGIVKFGRSTNPWKRIEGHCVDGKRYDQEAVLALISQVDNPVKVEQSLLIEASWLMDEISQESFRFKSVGDVAKCFFECRLPYFAVKVGKKPYRLTLTVDSFNFDPDEFSVDAVDDDPAFLTKRGIARAVIGNYGVFMSDIKAANRQRRVGDLKSCVLSMEKTGHLRIKRWVSPFGGHPSSDLDRAKFYPTDKTKDYVS